MKPRDLFHIAWLILIRLRDYQIAAIVDCSQPTVAHWRRTFIVAMEQWLPLTAIGGDSVDVEVDGMYAHGIRGMGVCIVGACETDRPENFRAMVVEAEDTTSAAIFLRKWVMRGSVLVSDQAKCYAAAEREMREHPDQPYYEHGPATRVTHRVEFVNKCGMSTNRIEGQWRLLRLEMDATIDPANALTLFLWKRENAGREVEGLARLVTVTGAN
jgi:hypothetical protein